MAVNPEIGQIPVSKIHSTFSELSETARSINAASDRLTIAIERLDAALKSLNLGITAWVACDKLAEKSNSPRCDLGYDKVGYGAWGLCLRHVGSPTIKGFPDQLTVWYFNQAPRELRLRAVAHLPELIEELNKNAARIATDLSDKSKDAEELAGVIGIAAKSGRKAEGSEPISGGKK